VGVRQVAAAHYREQASLAKRVAARIGRLWRRVVPQDIAGSWEAQLPEAALVVTAGQLAAARRADGYTARILGADDDVPLRVEPLALAGVASDGRGLTSLLYQPAITALAGIRDGATVDRAMAAGAVDLDMIVRTQVADAGRVADGVATTAQGVDGYIRLVQPGACSRCIILAGVFYEWNAGFLRHPSCMCQHVPADADLPDGLLDDPAEIFDAMTEAEQDKTFTKAGAQAIRDGADMNQVVNARRGMQAANVLGRDVLITTEGTTRRGNAGRRMRGRGAQVRLMPETIYAEADGDRGEAIRLLRLHGYLIGEPRRPAPPPVKAAPARVPAQRTEPVPPPAAPAPEPSAEDLLRRGIASGIREEKELSDGAVGTVHLVTFNDGSQAIRKVAAKAMFGYQPERLTDNELLAAKVGRAVRAPVPAVVRVSSTEVLMEYVPDARPGQWMVRGHDYAERLRLMSEFIQTGSGDDGRRLGLLDLLIANDDRHDANWLIRPADNSIAGIDHGLAWPAVAITDDAIENQPPRFSSKFASVFNSGLPIGIQGFKENDLTPADIDWVEERLLALEPDFEAAGRSELFRYSLARLRQLRPWARGTVDRIRP
jgi:hypothetical protein